MSAIQDLSDGELEALNKIQQSRKTSHVQVGLRKAAILLVTLDSDVGAEVFKNLSDDEMELVSQEIAALGMVKRDEMLGVLQEFKDMVMMQKLLKEGGYDHAIGLITRSLPRNKALKLGLVAGNTRGLVADNAVKLSRL